MLGKFRLNSFVSWTSVMLVFFLFGFAGRQLASPGETNTLSTVPVAEMAAPQPPQGVLYNGGFANYAATVTAGSSAVHKSPDDSSAVIQNYSPTNLAGTPTTFLMTGQQLENSRTTWYQVLLPLRPNNTKGWIHADDVAVTGMQYRIEIHRQSFRLDFYKYNVKQASYPIGLGTDETPTPDGTYSVVELLRPPNPNGVYGTHVLGLSGYSDVITDWPGGGHIAIHGTDQPEKTIGNQVSHGCIRLRNGDVDQLAKTIPLGTPVRITND